MNRQDIKEKYDRFKQWQEQPFDYKLNSGKVHHCINCGHDFTGNFCVVLVISSLTISTASVR